MRYMKTIYVDVRGDEIPREILGVIDLYLREIREHAEEAGIASEVDYDQDWDLVKEDLD